MGLTERKRCPTQDCPSFEHQLKTMPFRSDVLAGIVTTGWRLIPAGLVLQETRYWQVATAAQNGRCADCERHFLFRLLSFCIVAQKTSC